MNSLKKIKEWLNTFTSFNEQEQVDCQRIRQFLEEEENLLLRDNVKMHFTASAWVLNPSKNKVLMLYHNIYQSYSWLGGHADGDPDLFAVALREAKEESGITELAPFSQDILALDILPVPAHIKRGKPVKEHEHLNVTYLFIAPTDQTLTVKADENSAVAWIPIADLPKVVSEARMLPVYEKLIARSRQWKAEALREKEPR